MCAIRKTTAIWRTALILLAIYAAVLAAATFIEAARGTPFVMKTIYHSWWFIALHVFLIAFFIVLSLRHSLAKRRRWDLLMIHYGFVILLAGAMATHLWSYDGIMHVREGETSNVIIMSDKSVREVPFTVELEDFSLIRYKWSRTPSSYESRLRITYEGESFSKKVFMNNIARFGGFRIYQTSYDQDEKGTVLTVSNDRRGTLLSYAGYFILFAGLILSLFRRGGRFASLYKSLGKAAKAVALCCLFTLPANGLNARPLKTVDKGHAEEFSGLLVQSMSGRIEPVNTYSGEILRKIYHRSSYKGLTSDQVLIGLITSPEQWSHEPLIYISSGEVAERVGAKGRYVSFEHMFDPQGHYRIGPLVEDIARKTPAERSKTDKEYLKLDEKVNILYALFNGEMFPVFPAGEGMWLSSGSDKDGLNPKDSLVVGKTMAWYADAVRAGGYAEARKVTDIIGKYQNAKAGRDEINPRKIKAEMLYNKADIFRWSFRLYLIFGFALVLASLLSSSVAAGKVCRILTLSVLVIFLFHTAGIGLRWYISGYAPLSNSYEIMVYVAWSAVLAGLLFARRSYPALGLSAMLAGVVLFVANLNWLDPQITPLVPVLKSHWLMIHVSVITASYGFFGICALCGITSLAGVIAGRDLRQLRVINEISMHIGLVLLTIGIFFGAVWANESWGRYWGWDPKETWALITMLVYAFIIHARFIPKLNNPFIFDVMSVTAIASVLMTFFGVNYYLSGLHSYGSGLEASFSAILIVAVLLAALFAAAGYKYKQRQGNK